MVATRHGGVRRHPTRLVPVGMWNRSRTSCRGAGPRRWRAPCSPAAMARSRPSETMCRNEGSRATCHPSRTSAPSVPGRNGGPDDRAVLAGRRRPRPAGTRDRPAARRPAGRRRPPGRTTAPQRRRRPSTPIPARKPRLSVPCSPTIPPGARRPTAGRGIPARQRPRHENRLRGSVSRPRRGSGGAEVGGAERRVEPVAPHDDAGEAPRDRRRRAARSSGRRVALQPAQVDLVVVEAPSGPPAGLAER